MLAAETQLKKDIDEWKARVQEIMKGRDFSGAAQIYRDANALCRRCDTAKRTEWKNEIRQKEEDLKQYRARVNQ
ncbi:hypothetical protein [Candidatus Hepatobacter penaei]|uniref:hypothetical protein n=1 Tax=Candidatus Hepatobacter penaei TaxID=1274402 RepID=UPI0012E0435D|nr:hypothetical protein [Candidatus Hepatobacter penaei]